MKNTAESRERIALANADYEERRGGDLTQAGPTIRKIEKEWRLQRGQLTYYRANRCRREDVGVSKFFFRQPNTP